MSLNNLIKVGAVALPKVEQAAAWMIGQGPIIEHPELPVWVLRTLVGQNRVARLRRGVDAGAELAKSYPQREAVRFALEKLTTPDHHAVGAVGLGP